jgi:hypothetical protein
MRRRYRRRTGAHYVSRGHSMFGGTGWLFADLLLALAMAFLLATTVGATPPKQPPKPPATVRPTPSPTASRPKQSPPPLQLDPVHIEFAIADPAGLAAGNRSDVTAVRNVILQQTNRIKDRSAGIVLLFGGDGNGTTYPTYEDVDQGVENVLKSLSGTGPLFHQETHYVAFLNQGSPDQFSMDVYLFAGAD